MRAMFVLLATGIGFAQPALSCSAPIDPAPSEMPKQLVSLPTPPAETGAAKPPAWLTGKAVSDADYHRDLAAKLRTSAEELRQMIARSELAAMKQDDLAAKAEKDFAARIAREEALWVTADAIILATMAGNVQRKEGTFANFKPTLTLKAPRKITTFNLENNAIPASGGGGCVPPLFFRHSVLGNPRLYFFRKGALNDASLIETLDSSALASPMIREKLRLATEKAGIWPVRQKKRGR